MRPALAVVLMSAPLLRAWQVPVDQTLNKEIHTIIEYCRPALANPLDRTVATQCGQAIFNGSPFHAIARMYSPGNGVGLGLAYTREFSIGEKWKNLWELGGSGSFGGAWEGHTFLKLNPKFGPPPSLDQPVSKIKDRVEIQFYASAERLTKLQFYGLGPHSSLRDLAFYSQRRNILGAGVVVPVTWWFNIGGKIEGLSPRIGAASDSIHSPVSAAFTQAQAPGIATQPTFSHYEFYVRPHYPAQEPYWLLYKVSYGFYQDLDTGRYSFRRFRADLLNNLYLERSKNGPRRDSILSLYGRLTLSDASAGHLVPFYLQDTLGGSDIDADPALRAFADYRFRAPNALLFEAEWDRRLWKVLGIMAFFDTGKVAIERADIDLSGMRHSVGGGLTFWSASRVVFRVYVGFGGGEGHHIFTGIMPLPGPVGAPYRSY
ncbi:MAG: hypothetical protein ABSH44_08365 [Bryobacteraceae bacterium]|jgi:hypothetical protein